MPSRLRKRKDYNLVDDGYDSRVPLHDADAFRHGISFKAKYIGTLDVPRPTGRMEIVVAMRRIRYEFKAKSINKRKVNIRVSTDGVRVILRKKKKKKEWSWDLDKMLIMHDPIYRIFYVSHDSHDLKIWSYIARDGSSNVFRCNVFKSPKKSLAMQIVRTVGQAFEVCHKLNIGPPSKKEDKPAITDKANEEETGDKVNNENEEPKQEGVDSTASNLMDDSTASNEEIVAKVSKSLSSDGKPPLAAKDRLLSQSTSEPISIQVIDSSLPLSVHHQLQLSQQKILQAEQQTGVAVAQVHLLKDQLAAETTARIEARARNHQLLVQNRELLQQLSDLVARLSEVEAKLNNTVSDHQLSVVLGKVVLDPMTPASGGIQDAVLPGTDLTKVSPFVDTSLFENTNASAGAVSSSEVSKFSNGMLVTGADTSTSTMTKSSMGSGSVKAKNRRKMYGEGFESSSESSSDEEEGLSAAIRLANESGTVKNFALDAPTSSLANGGATGNQTANTSIWTSGFATPVRMLSGQGYQQSAASFNDTFLTTTVNDSSLSNGYTLSPIFMVGKSEEAHSSFQHFSVTEADDSLRIGDTPKSSIKKTITKSFSTNADMHSKERSGTTMSRSGGDLVQSNPSGDLPHWPNVPETEDPWEETFQSQLLESSNKSSDLNTTPHLEPPPSRVRRAPSSHSQPEYRPRPDISPPRVPPTVHEGITSPKLIDTSDSDLEVPPKLAKYNQGVKMSQSSYAHGSDPLLSRFDPLLLKSKSFDHHSPMVMQKEIKEPSSTVLSPVQDVGQSNPFLYITPQTPESSKYCKPVNLEELSKSYSDLKQSSTLHVTGVFTSPEEYETKLRYEPLRKQQASEWYPSTSKITESRLNSSFHAGDGKKEVTFHKPMSEDGARDPLPVYRTYSDLPSTVTPIKKKSATVSDRVILATSVHSIGSLNSNNSNSGEVKNSPEIMKNGRIANSAGSASSRVLMKEPLSVGNNVLLPDNLFISGTEDESEQKTQNAATLMFAPNNRLTGQTEELPSEPPRVKRVLAEEISLLDDIMGIVKLQDENSDSAAKNVSLRSKKSDFEPDADTTSTGYEASDITVPELGCVAPTSESHPTSIGSNSDSGVSGCGGFKHDQTMSSTHSYAVEH